MESRWKLAVTYFVGYAVERVDKTSDGFRISFGQGSITSHDGDAPPSQVMGGSLAAVDYGDGTTTLTFTGGATVALTPSAYEVSHPVCGDVWPERDDTTPSALPPDPSDERAVDGPVEA